MISVRSYDEAYASKTFPRAYIQMLPKTNKRSLHVSIHQPALPPSRRLLLLLTHSLPQLLSLIPPTTNTRISPLPVSAPTPPTSPTFLIYPLPTPPTPTPLKRTTTPNTNSPIIPVSPTRTPNIILSNPPATLRQPPPIMVEGTEITGAIFTVVEGAGPARGDLHRGDFLAEGGGEVCARGFVAEGDVFAVAFVAYCCAVL